MPPNDEARALAKKYEPILLFHQDEKVFPIDPKWYLERCSLWKAVAKLDDKANWGQPAPGTFPRDPDIAKNGIAAVDTEATGSRTWLGDAASNLGVSVRPPGEYAPPAEEHFLDFAGWEPSDDVTATSANRHAVLDPGNYTALAGSIPWYYVEFLDNQELQDFVSTRHPNGLDLTRLVASNPRLGGPRALLYHLLYPLHQEALEGCENAGEGSIFATYAGEWASVALLLDSADTVLFVGLTSRNIGAPGLGNQVEPRIGMRVYKETEVQWVDTHPKLFVLRGTHGHYPSEGT